MRELTILTINPGSTSTKVALFCGDHMVFKQNVEHAAMELAQFPSVSDQKAYRTQKVRASLQEAEINLSDIDAVVGRGGGLFSVTGGTYTINEKMVEHAAAGANGVQHPAQLGPQIAYEFSKELGIPAFVVNPPDVDELQDVARMTGISGVYRTVHLHALNLKETAIRHAKKMGKAYEECRFIVCHLGGGISISAHAGGRMIDGFDIAGGEGPMAPTRCGTVSVDNILRYIERVGIEKVKQLCTKTGGFVSLMGTSDAREVESLAAQGDARADMVWRTMLYQITKSIGAMACALGGRVDAILLSGGMVYSKGLVSYISENCGWIAPVSAYPGEFEMEAMSAGAIRVMQGVETAKEYTGEPNWKGFPFDD